MRTVIINIKNFLVLRFYMSLLRLCCLVLHFFYAPHDFFYSQTLFFSLEIFSCSADSQSQWILFFRERVKVKQNVFAEIKEWMDENVLFKSSLIFVLA